jgi:hypothetical protein
MGGRSAKNRYQPFPFAASPFGFGGYPPIGAGFGRPALSPFGSPFSPYGSPLSQPLSSLGGLGHPLSYAGFGNGLPYFGSNGCSFPSASQLPAPFPAAPSFPSAFPALPSASSFTSSPQFGGFGASAFGGMPSYPSF